MSFLTAITQAQITAAQTELNGKVLTRPALLVTDGSALLYAVDVDIGQANAVLKNVPLARANHELMYAEPGNACRLRRTTNGRFEVVGFSKEMPGRYERFTLDLATLQFGSIQQLGIEARPLTYGELATLGRYGATPYGVTGLFQGGQLREIRT